MNWQTQNDPTRSIREAITSSASPLLNNVCTARARQKNVVLKNGYVAT